MVCCVVPEFLERKQALLVKDRFATDAQVMEIKDTMMTNTRLSYILSRLQLGKLATATTRNSDLFIYCHN